MTAAVPRALFVNSGILGHRAVASLLEQASALMTTVNSTHVNLSEGLTFVDRVQRWVLSRRLAPDNGSASNVDLRRWREELNVGLLAARRIRDAERAGTFDVVHVHPQPAAYALLARMARSKVIVSIDATSHLASLEAPSRLGRATYLPNIVHDGAVFRGAAGIISTSKWAADDLAERYPDCAAKTHVLPYPIQSSVEPELVAARYERARTGAPVRALFMGGDFRRKGGFDLLDAWREARFGDRAALDVVTDWPLEPSQVPPGARIVAGVAPHTPAWRELWRAADLFVMPTHHEAFGMVFQEAAAAGIPAVATNINAVPEIVLDGTTGVLVAPNDRRALVDALRGLVDAPEERRRLGAAALERISREGSLARYARGLESVIHHAVEHAITH